MVACDIPIMEDVRKTLAAQASLLTELLTQAAEPVLQKGGLSLATFELLSAVKAASHDVSQGEIARRLGITPPSLTQSVRIARDKGLIVQVDANPDRRKKNLRLTPSGERMIREILASVNQAESAMVEGIDSGALTTTIETLQAANRNLARTLNRTRD